ILQGIMKRYEEGSASSTQALTYGRMARPMAELAIEYLTGEQRL
ncbi:MAG: phosphotransferase family protein, partial [Gammaproteobacteria bacterium]